MISLNTPIGYLPQPDTVDAINLAIALGQPLLITGEPGCGKTAFADWVAFKLGLGTALRFQTKSSSVSRDLFYTFDAVGRFHAAQAGRDSDPRRFISYRGLGEAIVRAKGRQAVTDIVSPAKLDTYSLEPMRSVVLIDEIDKAVRDFPNDVLGEIERFSIEIPELALDVKAPQEFLPIVIITSNAERSLPDAFLRRCLFHHMPFPTDELLRDIVATRISNFPASSSLLTDAIDLVSKLRSSRARIGKVPGTAELLAFILALRNIGYAPNDSLKRNDRWFNSGLTTLIKSVEGYDDARSTFDKIASGSNA